MAGGVIKPRYIVRNLAGYGLSSIYSIYDRKEDKYVGKFIDMMLCIKAKDTMDNFHNKNKKEIEVIING
jgi:hypothetical protein